MVFNQHNLKMDIVDRIASSYRYPTPFSNSSSFLWLLLSLLSQEHSPDTSNSFSSVYDYIVVGAGSAGSVVASRLSECPTVSVLLLEAGGVPPVVSDVPIAAGSLHGTDLDWKYKTVSQKHTGAAMDNRQGLWPLGKALGGSSILNAMVNVRGIRENYYNWDKFGAKGWGYEDVLPYFKKLEDNQELGPSEYHGVHGPVSIMTPEYSTEIKTSIAEAASELEYSFVDINGPSQIGFYDNQYSQRKGQRCSTAKAYLVPAGKRQNLDIVINAFVTKILISNDTAYGIQFDKNGSSHVVTARKEVILSAGAVNSVQLLMLSGIGPEEELSKFNIPVIKELPVGKNLQDHFRAFLSYTVNGNIMKFEEKMSDERYIEDYIRSRSGPFTCPRGVLALAFLPNNRNSSHIPDYQLYLSEGYLQFFKRTGLKKEVYDQYYKEYEDDTIFWCYSSNLHPKSRGQITLNSANPYDPPIIDPNYLEHPDDVNDVVQGMMTCNSLANTRAMRRIGMMPLKRPFPGCEDVVMNEYAYLECQARSTVNTCDHPVGTARMGRESDPDAVVDPELRVIGIRGLRVVDASVMPVIPSGNTNIPTIMVAEKGSDIIKRDIPGCL